MHHMNVVVVLLFWCNDMKTNMLQHTYDVIANLKDLQEGVNFCRKYTIVTYWKLPCEWRKGK
jgi:hypothetical protein